MNVKTKTSKRSEHIEAVRDVRSFDGGTVWADTYPNGLRVTLGDLPPQWSKELSVVDGPLYVVFSYRTPIAWRTHDRIVIPPVKYSATTTRHQNIVKEAWSL
ncbi:hypothetical protein PQD13_gp82 [Gordonia phage Clawz]|uniref:DUF8033 domain-containing protein n=1 Tax=Gordonia phage Clawz TaxID=2743910 RepID=A0AAE7F8X0_9CAUD|nr:hypothetical protein PQD13_gp82 [Gordonia phage Clawz]QKY79994.1 hypothetical protein SEA_CLAWZ_82 [Gordonia phage Clawz]